MSFQPENRRLYQHLPEASADSSTGTETDEKRQEEIDDTRQTIEKLDQKILPSVIHQVVEKSVDPQELKRYLEETGYDNLEEAWEHLKGAKLDSFEAWKEYFDEKHGPGVTEMIDRLRNNKALSEQDYTILANLYVKSSSLLNLAEKRKKAGGLTPEEMEQHLNDLSSWELFRTLFPRMDKVERMRVLTRIIDQFKTKISPEQIVNVLRDMREQNVVTETEIKTLNARDPDLKLNQALALQGQTLAERLKVASKKAETAGGSGLADIPIEMLKLPDPQKTEANTAARLMSLKNLFLVEYLARLMALGLALDIAPDIIAIFMAKKKEERFFHLKHLLTNPYSIGKAAGLALIYENVTHTGKGISIGGVELGLGQGIVSDALGVTAEAHIAGRIQEFIAKERKVDQDYAVTDYEFMRDLGKNRALYRGVQHFSTLTMEEIEGLKKKLQNKNLTLVQVVGDHLGLKNASLMIKNSHLNKIPASDIAQKHHALDLLVLIARDCRFTDHPIFSSEVLPHFQKKMKALQAPGKKFQLLPSGEMLPQFAPPEDSEE